MSGATEPKVATGSNKPILALDFDGVIHSYERGWQDGAIYGSVIPGFWEWAEQAASRFTLVISSSRCADPNMVVAMSDWLRERWNEFCVATELLRPMPGLHFAHQKPPAFLTIDDRGLRFEGDWRAPELQPDRLREFKPWNQRP